MKTLNIMNCVTEVDVPQFPCECEVTITKGLWSSVSIPQSITFKSEKHMVNFITAVVKRGNRVTEIIKQQ
jgi:hypothetical protein